MQAPLTGFHQNLRKIFSQGPLQDLVPDLHYLRTCKTATRKSCKIFKEGLPEKSQDLLTRISWESAKIAKISTAPQRERSDTHKLSRRCASHVHIRTTPQRREESHEGVARAISKFAPRHPDRDLTRTGSREGCTSTC